MGWSRSYESLSLAGSVDAWGCVCRQERTEEREREREETEGRKKQREGEGRVNNVASSSSYRVFGGPTSLDAGSQVGTDGPKRGFLFGVGFCSTTFSILKRIYVEALFMFLMLG